MDSRHAASNKQYGEKEREEIMKQQLLDVDMYDENMTMKEMEDCLRFIDESKKAVSHNNFNSEIVLRSPSSDVTNSSPSPSEVDNHMIPMSASKITGRDTTSPESLDDSYQNKKFQLNDSESYDERIFDSPKKPININVDDSIRTIKVTEETTNSRYDLSPSPIRDFNVTRRNSQEIKHKLSQRSSKSLYNVDVLNCKILLNDVPLKPRFVPKPRQKLQFIDGIPIISDETIAKKNIFLTEMANLAHSWMAKLDCNEFSWGPPIKVGTANGSLDKFPIHEKIRNYPKQSANQSRVVTEEVDAIGSPSGSTEKKKNINKNKDRNSDSIVAHESKGTKKNTSDPVKSVKKTQQKNVNKQTNEKKTENIKSVSKIVNNDVEQTNKMSNDQKKTRSMTSEFTEEFPQKNVESSISLSTIESNKKTSQSVVRPKKRNASSENSSDENNSEKTSSFQSESELEETIINGDDESKQMSYNAPPSKRLNQSIKCLKKVNQMEEQNRQKREEEAKLLIEQEARKLHETKEKRIKKREESMQQQKNLIKLQEKREEQYRHVADNTRCQRNSVGSSKKRTELESQVPRPRSMYYSSEKVENENFPRLPSKDIHSASDAESNTVDPIENISSTECPICRKLFPLTEIENHAANCDDFIQDKPKNNQIELTASASNNPTLSNTFTCQICSITTPNKDALNKHFLECINSLTDDGIKNTEVTLSNQDNNKLISSPSNFDLEINQTKQLSTRTYKKKSSGPQKKKRKKHHSSPQ